MISDVVLPRVPSGTKCNCMFKNWILEQQKDLGYISLSTALLEIPLLPKKTLLYFCNFFLLYFKPYPLGYTQLQVAQYIFQRFSFFCFIQTATSSVPFVWNMVFQNQYLSNGYYMWGLRVYNYHKFIFYKHVVFPSGTGLFASIFLSVFTAISTHKKMITSPSGDKIKALCFSFR